MARAALLRPLNLLMLAIGAVAFVATQAWWMLPLTLVTYATLVFLASRDPFFRRRVLGDGAPTPASGSAPGSASGADSPAESISPERRARWLPRGETRQEVEKALVAYRKVVAAIEDADDVTRAVLDDAVPKLHAAADRLVKVAHDREKLVKTHDELLSRSAPDRTTEDRSGDHGAAVSQLEADIRRTDAEISGITENFAILRVQTTRASVEGDAAARTAADELNRSLDELNLKLEALNETMSPRQYPPDTERS